MRVLFAGDIHGSPSHLDWVMREAHAQRADLVVPVGDFGFWPHLNSGQRYLTRAHKLADRYGIPIWWVPGNHENWDTIDDLVDAYGLDAPIPTWTKYVAKERRGLVCLLGRPSIVELGAARAVALGGAWSVDWQYREPGYSWWPQEVLTAEHLDALEALDPLGGGRVDLLIAHEAPDGPTLSYKDEVAVSIEQREIVAAAMDRLRPKLVVSGHHHTRLTWWDEASGARVEVLNRDVEHSAKRGVPVSAADAQESVLLVDLDALHAARSRDEVMVAVGASPEEVYA